MDDEPTWNMLERLEAKLDRLIARSERGLLTPGREIERYVGRGRRTLHRWIKEYDFPALHMPSGELVTTPGLVDRWLHARFEAERAQPPRERKPRPAIAAQTMTARMRRGEETEG